MEHLGIDETMLREILKNGPPLDSDMSNEEAVEKAMSVVNGEMQLKDIKGITDEEMEAAYANGYNMFRAGSYEKAEEMFMFLGTFDNGVKKYWTALGACRFNMKNYMGALMAYTQAALLDVDDPELLIKVAQCRLSLGQKDAAIGGLEAAIEFAGDKPQRAGAREKAEAILSLLQGQD